MEQLEDLADPAVPISTACAALGVSRSTLYRHTSPPPPPSYRERPRSHRRIPDEQRQEVLAVMNSEEFADQPPAEVYGSLLSQGIYLASMRTMYRILAENEQSRERRNQRAPGTHATPRLTATGPNQVWTWDITKLPTTMKGVFLSLYVIIDLFSRYVVGWLLAEQESKELAIQLFEDTIALHGIKPGEVVVHADRGGPMKSDGLAQLLSNLGVTRSFSRPRVSNDNAFSESQFKTLKYQPDYPGEFTGMLHGRGWLQEFFDWHNNDHHHTGLSLFTPADVFTGRFEEVLVVRQRALDAAYEANPERFVKGPPKAARPPAAVSINPVAPGDNEPSYPEEEPHPSAVAHTPSTAPGRGAVNPAEGAAERAERVDRPSALRELEGAMADRPPSAAAPP